MRGRRVGKRGGEEVREECEEEGVRGGVNTHVQDSSDFGRRSTVCGATRR